MDRLGICAALLVSVSCSEQQPPPAPVEMPPPAAQAAPGSPEVPSEAPTYRVEALGLLLAPGADPENAAACASAGGTWEAHRSGMRCVGMRLEGFPEGEVFVRQDGDEGPGRMSFEWDLGRARGCADEVRRLGPRLQDRLGEPGVEWRLRVRADDEDLDVTWLRRVSSGGASVRQTVDQVARREMGCSLRAVVEL